MSGAAAVGEIVMVGVSVSWGGVALAASEGRAAGDRAVVVGLVGDPVEVAGRSIVG